MPTQGQFNLTYTDYDSEHTTHGFRVTTLTAGNFDAQAALMATYISAVDAITLGIRYKDSYGNAVLNNIGASDDTGCQIELKWLVQYHDNTTLQRYHIEIGTADPAQLDAEDRAHAEIGDAGVVDAFITALEAYALSPDGNAITVDEITLVPGRR